MSTALLLIGDGRDDYRARTLVSADLMLPTFDHVVEVDDREHRLGFGGAIQEGWRRVLATDATHIFHLELDFTFNRPVDVNAMRAVLDAHPRLVQLALRRQPWNEQEKAAGGIVEQYPDDYTWVQCGERDWLEHVRNFTTNPSLYPRWVAERGWPDGPQSEGRFGLDLIAERPELRFAFWGSPGSGEAVTHIGAERHGCGY